VKAVFSERATGLLSPLPNGPTTVELASLHFFVNLIYALSLFRHSFPYASWPSSWGYLRCWHVEPLDTPTTNSTDLRLRSGILKNSSNSSSILSRCRSGRSSSAHPGILPVADCEPDSDPITISLPLHFRLFPLRR
jgi:hypothetical protein